MHHPAIIAKHYSPGACYGQLERVARIFSCYLPFYAYSEFGFDTCSAIIFWYCSRLKIESIAGQISGLLVLKLQGFKKAFDKLISKALRYFL